APGRPPAEVRAARDGRRSAGGSVTAGDAAVAVAADRALLAESVVILTGATGGIGRAVASLLAAAGARVAVTDLADEPVRALASELDVFGAAGDAASWDEFQGFHGRVERDLGPVDGVVNCAGLWAPAPYEEIGPDAFAETIQANL